MSYKIPLFDLNFDQKEINAVAETITSNWISTGPKCGELEQIFIDNFRARYAISVSSCTSALHLALMAMNIGVDDEVICPSLTFVASANAIKYVGANPIFCDVVGYDNFNIDPDKIETLITKKTKAILVVHFAGFPCNMDAIKSLALKYNLKIIEDSCHGPLSEYKGEKLGAIGDVGCFSFFSNKNISTGEGGMVITSDEKIANKIKLLRSHGMTTMSYQRAEGHATVYDVVELGYNYRMDDIRASIGVVQMNKLQSDLEKRLSVRAKYVDCLSNIKGIYIPFEANTEFVSNYIMPIVLKDSTAGKRDAVRNELHKAGIQTSVHYPAVHKFSMYKDLDVDLPITEYIADNEITLPMFAALKNEDIEFIANTLNEILSE